MLNMEDLYRLLRTGHVQAQGIVDTIDEPLLVLDASLCVQNASRAFFETFKVERYETIGQPIYELGNGQWNIPALRLLLEQVLPKATAIINYEVEHDFPGLGLRTMLVTARTLNHPDRTSHSMLLSLVDVTEGRAKDAAKDMLFGELRHRMKNVLGVAQSIARQMPTEGRSAEEFRQAFLGRFGALMEAQDIAFSEQDDAGLRGLIERVLAPYADEAGNAVVVDGPEVTLAPRTLMSLGMVLHELATNAVKHGSLSVPGGQVQVGWTLEEGCGILRLQWSESGGPRVALPATTSYGTKLINYTTSYSLHGKLEQDYAPGGLQVQIVVPLGKASLPS
jgi:two-component sensor histidine kinase